jgi:enoyl-CoA hydratase/carnithine racemase
MRVAVCRYARSMKTTLSIPEPLLRKADRLARKMKKSRSQLFRGAISEYVSRHDPADVTKVLDDLYSELDTRPHRSHSEAVRRLLVSTEW